MVTLLLDNSGSMRGRPILVAAMSADILGRTLERRGVKTEILGFTTRAWKDGLARGSLAGRGQAALARPSQRSAPYHLRAQPPMIPGGRPSAICGLMMREGLLKVNIDSKALPWAAGPPWSRGPNSARS